jgi:hypothetical protein
MVAMTRVIGSGRTLLVAVGLFFVGLLVHESAHLAVLHLIGSQGSLIVRPWQFATFDLTLPSLHVQPNPPLDTTRQAIMNFSGPAVAAALFALALRWIRDPDLQPAVAANVSILVFFALIETAYVLLWAAFRIDAEILVTPEFNYGVPLLIILIAAGSRALKPPVQLARSRGSTASSGA